MKMNTIIKDDATPKKPIDDDGIAPRETKEMAKKEENFFKIFGIILVLIVFYLPFLSTFMIGGQLNIGEPTFY